MRSLRRYSKLLRDRGLCRERKSVPISNIVLVELVGLKPTEGSTKNLVIDHDLYDLEYLP